MSLLLDLKQGTSRSLGGLLLLTSIIVLIFHSWFKETFQLTAVDDLISFLSLASFLTIILYYVGVNRFLVWFVLLLLDSKRTMPPELNFRYVDQSVRLEEIKNSILSTVYTLTALILLFLELFFNSGGRLYKLLFEGDPSRTPVVEPILGTLNSVWIIILLIVLIMLFLLRLLLDLKKANKYYDIIWKMYILEFEENTSLSENLNKVKEYLKVNNWDLGKREENKYLSKVHKGVNDLRHQLAHYHINIEILNSGEFDKLLSFQRSENSDSFMTFLEVTHNYANGIKHQIANLKTMGLHYLLLKNQSKEDKYHLENFKDKMIYFEICFNDLTIDLQKLKSELSQTKLFDKWKDLYYIDNIGEREITKIRKIMKASHYFIDGMRLIVCHSFISSSDPFSNLEQYMKIKELWNKTEDKGRNHIETYSKEDNDKSKAFCKSKNEFLYYLANLKESGNIETLKDRFIKSLDWEAVKDPLKLDLMKFQELGDRIKEKNIGLDEFKVNFFFKWVKKKLEEQHPYD